MSRKIHQKHENLKNTSLSKMGLTVEETSFILQRWTIAMIERENNDIGQTYIQLTNAEAAASQMEKLLDSIEAKMEQLEQLQRGEHDVAELQMLDEDIRTLDEQMKKLEP